MTSFANDFEPSMRAAAALGPKTRNPKRRSASARPRTSGSSGPTTTRSTSSERARPSRPSASSRESDGTSPTAAIPGFPGAAWSSVRSATARASTRARARDPRADDEDSHRASLVSVAGLPRAVGLRGVDEAAVPAGSTDYVAAWQTYDADAIGPLFSDDADYRYHPWDESDKVARAARRSSRAGSRSPTRRLVDGRVRAVARRRRPRGRDRGDALPRRDDGEVEREYHNVFLLVFDDDGRCREFSELYMRRPD